MALLSVDQALERLLDAVSPLEGEEVPLDDVLGRSLKVALKARLTQPPFHSSAMDGYACHADDIKALPQRLKVVGESAAGHAFHGTINKGEAIRIFTGAPVPDDADTVIIQENTKRLDDNMIECLQGVDKGQNIRPRGNDFNEGQNVLEAGHIMTASALSLAAAAGHARLHVVRRPRIGVLATGDELVEAGTLPGPDQIVSSNSHGLAAILRLHQADIIDLGIAKDNKDSIRAAIERAKQAKVDILVTSGGVSVGDYDLVQTVLQEEGMVLDFWKIAMRPGKPLMFGRLPQSMFVLGLPGNPVSSLSTCQLFLVPVIEKMAGRPFESSICRATLLAPLKANKDRRHFIRGVYHKNADGSLSVTPASSHDSSLLRIMAHSNCMIVHRENAPAMEIGESCEIMIPLGGL